MIQPPPFLICPECHSGKLEPVRLQDRLPAPYDSDDGFECTGCGRSYPIVDNVFVLWSDQVRDLLLNGDLSDSAQLSDRVKKANIEIYNEVTEEYGEHHDGSQPYGQTLLFLKALADDYRARFSRPGDKSVLVDVGCATGASLDRGGLAYKYAVGVDISLGNLRAVVARGFTAVLADAEKLPFRPGSIDLITCFATLHHFPAPESFVRDARRSLCQDGVLMIAGEPSHQAMGMGVLAKLAWDLRKPVYRFLGRFSDRYYMHRSREQQERNDLAEFNRTGGGFAEDQLTQMLGNAGFGDVKLFYGTDPEGYVRFAVPPWQQLILRALSFQNPFRPRSWQNLTVIGRQEGSSMSGAPPD